MPAPTEVADALARFGGDPQRAGPLASFLGFQPVQSPVDQLAGKLQGGLKWFFARRSDWFGVRELYRAGSYDASPGRAGLWVAVLSDWGTRSVDRDRPRRRLARAMLEQVQDSRSMVILVPNNERRAHVQEAEFVLPRSSISGKGAAARGMDASGVTTIRALVDLQRPNRFHRDLLRELTLKPGASLLEVSQHWQKVFSVETVATRFYQEYMKVRDRMAEALLAGNPHHAVVAGLKEEERKAWATRQMGRMLFLWFLQSKGWLGEPEASGPKDYLLRLWQKRRQAPGAGYYRGLLLPLFFEAMATGKVAGPAAEVLGYTPYLNGGLFRRNRLEDRIDGGGPVSLPDDVFDPEPGDGRPATVLGLLSGYRFTTRESTPDDQSVDPDPELLGRVFENLYQGDERKKTGTYYTPREVVHFMCRQALDGYLRDQAGVSQEILERLRRHVTEKDEEDRETLPAGLRQRLVEALEMVRVCDPAVGSGAFLLGIMQEMVLLRRGIEHAEREDVYDEDKLITEWKLRAIQHGLYGVDTNPEAVEICQLRLWLSLVLDMQEPRDEIPLPNLDFRIVAGDSLVDRVAGVVFKQSWPPAGQLPMSVKSQKRISELERQVDEWIGQFEKTHRDPARLRELRERVAVDQAEIVLMQFSEALARSREAEQHAGKATGRRRAEAGSAELEAVIKGLQGKDHQLVQKPFLWPVAFPGILDPTHSDSGFDIILANPPYVRQEDLRAGDQESYRQAFPEVYTGTADILVSFYARALQILRPGGWLAFITSNKYMRAAYGEKLREHLPGSLALEYILDFGDLPLFEANGQQVAAYPAVVIGRKEAGDNEHKLQVADLAYPIRRKLKEASKEGLPVTTENVRWALEELGGLLHDSAVQGYPQALLRKEGWILEDPALVRLFERLMDQGTPLGKFVQGRIYRGVITGLNEAFVIGQAKRDELVAADPRSAELIKPWLRGRDIKRWKAEWAGLYVIALQNSGDSTASNPWAKARNEAEASRIFREYYPAIHDHLSAFENDFVNRRGKKQTGLRVRQDQGRYWWELRACDYYPEFQQPKVIWPDITRTMRFAFDATGKFSGNTTYFSPFLPQWAVPLLNSNVFDFLLCMSSNALRGGFRRLFSQYLEVLPLPERSGHLEKDLADVSARCLGSPELEDGLRVDRMAAEAYRLSQQEATLIEQWAERSKHASAEDVSGEQHDD